MTARTDDTAARVHRARTYLAHGLAELADLETRAPAEVAAVLAMLVHRVRDWRPELVGATGACWPPPREVEP